MVARGEVEGGIVDDGSRGGDVVRDRTILSMGSIVGMTAAGVSIRPGPPEDPFVCHGSFGGDDDVAAAKRGVAADVSCGGRLGDRHDVVRMGKADGGAAGGRPGGGVMASDVGGSCP